MIKNEKKQFEKLAKIDFVVKKDKADSKIIHNNMNMIQLAHPMIGVLNIKHEEIKKLEKEGDDYALVTIVSRVLREYKGSLDRAFNKILYFLGEE